MCLTTLPLAPLALAIDGSHFCTLDADSHGQAQLEFAYSPSGNDRLEVKVRAADDASAIPSIEFAIELHKPGLTSVRGEHASLRPLRDAENLLAADAQPMRRDVAVVVPVYNAADAVQRCLDSVLAHSSGPWRLIVIDDASTEAGIGPLLERYRNIDGVDILCNPHNLGFTATVNRGIEFAGRADVVLLNADTEVAANWLTGLRLAVDSAADVATATAVSDNAGAFSVPELEQENPLPSHWSLAQTARALWQEAGHAYPQLPTGNGFCMFIKREVFDAIGVFDVEAFPQGYGEENDFCQRACARGYRHLIAGNVFVAHARSRSFGIERRESLGRAGMQVLRQRWPNYEAEVGATLFSFARRVLDWRVRRIYRSAAQHMPRPRVLRIATMAEVQAQECDQEILELTRLADTWILRRAGGDTLESVAIAIPDARMVAAWLQRHAIECIEFDATANHNTTEVFVAQARRLGIAVCEISAPVQTAQDGQIATIRSRFDEAGR